MTQNALTPSSLHGSTTGKAVWYRDAKIRGVFVQCLLLLILVGLAYEFVQNASRNLKALGIATGYGFMDNPAGFAVSQSLISYSESSSYTRLFFVGLLNTLLVSFVGCFFATIIGFVVGVGRLSRNWVVAQLSKAYVELTRNLPHLFHIFFWYIAVIRSLPSPREAYQPLPSVFVSIRGLYLPKPLTEPAFIWVVVAFLIGLAGSFWFRRYAKKRQAETGHPLPVATVMIALLVGLPSVALIFTGLPIGFEHPELRGFNFVGGLRIIPEFVALVVALTLYTAGFIAEIVRAGIQAVSHGQTEAASSLGLTRSQSLRLVIIPQALRIIIPPLTSQYLNLTKNSALGVAVGYPELFAVFAGTTLNQTGQAIEIIALTMAVYLFISLVTAWLMNIYNRRVALVER